MIDIFFGLLLKYTNTVFIFLFVPFLIIIIILPFILLFIGNWKLFQKAGVHPLISLVPVLNLIFILKIAKRPIWWALLFFIPVYNLRFMIIISNELGNAYGKSRLYQLGILLLPFIFIPKMGLDNSEYQYHNKDIQSIWKF